MAAFKLEFTDVDEKDLLIRIIHRAKQSGFKFRNLIDDYEYFSISTFNPESGRLVIILRNAERHQIIYDSIYLLFFDINFAKALFGENWEQHLDALAKSGNKLEYLHSNALID